MELMSNSEPSPRGVIRRSAARDSRQAESRFWVKPASQISSVTSMFSAVFFSRGLVNLWYGRKKKLKSVSIGTVWRPGAGQAITKPE